MMTNGIDADSVRLVHDALTHHTEQVVRTIAATLVGLMLAIPGWRKFHQHIYVPAREMWTSFKSWWDKCLEAVEGGAMIRPAVAELKQQGLRLERVESVVSRIDAESRAEWNATAQSRIRFDADCRLTFANATSLAIMRLDSSQALGMGWQNAVTEMDRDSVLKQMRDAAINRRDAEIAFPIDTPGSTSDARHFILHLNVVPNGTPLGFGGFVGWFTYRDGKECGLAPICPLGLHRQVALAAVS